MAGRRVERVYAFSGSRHGITMAQCQTLAALLWPLSQVDDAEFHQGGCVGADALAAEMVRNFAPKCVIHAWPASNVRGEWRALGHRDDLLHEPMDAVTRTRAYVDACDRYFACPREASMVQRSGTWAGIRYAANTGKPGCVIFPDGQYAFLKEFTNG